MKYRSVGCASGYLLECRKWWNPCWTTMGIFTSERTATLVVLDIETNRRMK